MTRELLSEIETSLKALKSPQRLPIWLIIKVFGGNFALKLDVWKAFNTIDWEFLLQVLQSFGFNYTFYNWIRVILNFGKLSFLVNGRHVGFFSCLHGVHQGDLLSHILFWLAKEVLNRGICQQVDSSSLSLISSPKGYIVPSHSLYTDDIILFCKGTSNNFKVFPKLFKDYVEVSGQQLNLSKCWFYGPKITSARALKKLFGLMMVAPGK